jgi:hypothetical protein
MLKFNTLLKESEIDPKDVQRKDYLENGHGGNVALRERDAREAMVSVLETARLTDTRQDILNSEYLWHRKLGTRTIRLDDA